jgi:hypothetical protein
VGKSWNDCRENKNKKHDGPKTNQVVLRIQSREQMTRELLKKTKQMIRGGERWKGFFYRIKRSEQMMKEQNDQN